MGINNVQFGVSALDRFGPKKHKCQFNFNKYPTISPFCTRPFDCRMLHMGSGACRARQPRGTFYESQGLLPLESNLPLDPNRFTSTEGQ